MPTKKLAPAGGRQVAAPAPQYRSGAVARMVRMPVSTLRIWERRYRVVAPATTPTGHRLYSLADVQRLALLRQLTDHGHAIGSIAALDTTQLQQVASTHANSRAGEGRLALSRPAPRRLVVVGAALARRLQRPAAVRQFGQSAEVCAVFDTLARAAEAAPTPPDRPVDLLLWLGPSLHVDALSELKTVQDAWGARCAAVVYRFAGAAARDAFVGAGILLLREPPDDAALGSWLAALDGSSAARGAGPVDTVLLDDPLWWAAAEAAPRRFDDDTLTDFAGLSSTISCECPRHVAELLMQLSNFEAYSADCEDRSPADAALHAYLRRVAGASRALFESALERVAIHEGLTLPA